MNPKALMCIVSIYFVGLTNAADSVPQSPNGVSLPENYKDWRVIGSSHREDNMTLRVILGNDTAIKAARAGKTNPWPKGAILGKLVWKDANHPNWKKATVPNEFVHSEFMIKDAKAFKTTGGWGFARWKGLDQRPYGKDESFVEECLGCHKRVKKKAMSPLSVENHQLLNLIASQV